MADNGLKGGGRQAATGEVGGVRLQGSLPDLPVDNFRLLPKLHGLTKREHRPRGAGLDQGLWRGSERVLTEIKLKKGESVEKALRRLKKKIDREGTLKVVRNHRHFEKPSERRRRKEKAARFSAMLSARYADM